MSVQRDASGETLHAENLFGLGIQWHSNEVGQLPADVSHVDLSALDPNHWDAQITQAPDCYPDFCSEELMSDIGFHITSLWRKGPAANVTVSQFTNGAPGWTVQSGQWAASNGYYRNSSNLEASIATAPATTEDRYAIDAKLYLEWSAAGNQGGLVYDFVDSRNYRGVLLSPGKKNADGSFRNASIQVLEVRNGVRKVVAR